MPKDEINKNKNEKPVLPFIKEAWKFFAFMFLGVTMTGIIGYSVLAWGVEMLVLVHELPKSYAGQNFGLFNIIFGLGGSLGFGLIASTYMSKGIKNANLLLAPITLFFCWVSLILFSLANNAIYAQLGLIGLIFFMSAGPGLYGSAVQNASPINLRARTASIYYISANVVGFALGPFALGFLNDNFFNYEDGIRYSLLALGIIAYPIAGFCFWYAAKLILPLIEQAENE
jgi:MFS family permease